MWHLPMTFPWKIQSVLESLIFCKLNCKINLKIVMSSDFLFKINECKNNYNDSNATDKCQDVKIMAVFKALSANTLELNKPIFCCKSVIF